MNKVQKDLEDCISKATSNATKWAFEVFSDIIYLLLGIFHLFHFKRTTKTLQTEQCSFTVDLAKIQSLDLNIANRNVESLNFWLKKFVQKFVKAGGSRYPGSVVFVKHDDLRLVK